MNFVIDPAEIQKLAPMPASVTKLVRLMTNPETNIQEICRVIEFDEALTSNVLRWGNSAWSGSSSDIKTIKESVIRLGTAQLLKLAVGYRLVESMKTIDVKFPGIEKKLWEHSVCSALVVEQLSSFTHYPVSPIAFTAALIHDIGKLLLYRHLDAKRIEEMWQFIEAGEKAVDVESGVLGTTHAMVGGEIAWFWKFPEEIIYAIEKHHDPNPPEDPIVAIVQVANTIANCTGEMTDKEMQLSSGVYSRLDLDLDKMENLRKETMTKLQETLQLWDS